VLLAACGGSDSAGDTTTTSSTTTVPAPVVVEIEESQEFTSPTGNIHCRVDVRFHFAECGIDRSAWSPPPRPADCEYDWGGTMVVVNLGAPADFDCRSDAPFAQDEPEPLPYGHTVMGGGVECTSRESGVTCTALDSQRGFEIAFEEYRFF